MIRTYSEMLRRSTFLERFEYLRLGGSVGYATFGFDRWINQQFYHSDEWRHVRRHVILRDEGRDLGVEGHEIQGSVLVHHVNPVDVADIVQRHDWIFDPEFLVSVTHATHNAIHYGDASQLRVPFKERRPGDTKLW